MKSTLRLKPNALGAYGITGANSDVAKMFIINQISSPKIDGELVLWLVNDISQAKLLEAYYHIWPHKNNDFPVLVPEEENLPQIFWHLIENQPGIVFLPLLFLTEPVITPKLFSDKSLALKISSRYTPAELAQQLVLIGYEFNTIADAPGRFARRGNVLDVFSPNEKHPIRFEFGQHELAAIKTYNEASGKIISELDNTIVIPAQIGHFEATGRWIQYLQLMKQSNVSFIYSDPDDIKSSTPYWSDLSAIMNKREQMVFYSLPNPDAKNEFDFKAAPIYHKNIKQLIKDVQKWIKLDYTIYSSNSLKSDLNGLWAKNFSQKTSPVTFLTSAFFEKEARGFISDQNKVVLLTDFEIKGYEEKQAKIKKKRFDLDFIAELKPGDLVVHLDHGIGYFRGLVTNIIDGIKKEYFKLEYAEGDKLSVPVELAYKIDKYVGSVLPKIHRLSNTSWRRITQKVRQEAKKMAKGLLQLYAQRETIKIEPFRKNTSSELELAKSFPYDETPDQQKAISEVQADLENDEPMDRLICGDVGFGKTEVAIRAAYKTVMNKKQVVVLAPTTILAQQHFDTFVKRLKKFPATIETLSRFKSRIQQKEIIAKLKTGETDIVIGTHRLLSSDVLFKNLGLIIIDEEQRFGVQHKEKLKSMRVNAHILTLTATPIPKTASDR